LEALLADDLRRAGLGRRARRHAEGFGWAATTNALVTAYEEAMVRRNRVPRPRGAVLAGVPMALVP
jgi:D-inositol-3-phosphate glycosyltransferase